MLRKVFALVAQPAQVNDLGQLGLSGRISERVCSRPVLFGEICAGQGMDEVVGGILALEGRKQAACDVDVSPSLPSRAAPLVLIGTSSQHGDVMAFGGQPGGQGRTDEAGPSGDGGDLHGVALSISHPGPGAFAAFQGKPRVIVRRSTWKRKRRA